MVNVPAERVYGIASSPPLDFEAVIVRPALAGIAKFTSIVPAKSLDATNVTEYAPALTVPLATAAVVVTVSENALDAHANRIAIVFFIMFLPGGNCDALPSVSCDTHVNIARVP